MSRTLFHKKASEKLDVDGFMRQEQIYFYCFKLCCYWDTQDLEWFEWLEVSFSHPDNIKTDWLSELYC